MSGSALITMITTWAVVAFFTIRFFVKVLKIPQQKEQAARSTPEP